MLTMNLKGFQKFPQKFGIFVDIFMFLPCFYIYLFATSKLKSAVLLNYVSKGSNWSNVF